jgi:nicotinamide-nucleotide amidase
MNHWNAKQQVKDNRMHRSDTIEEAAKALVEALLDAGKTVAAAESCTGGWVAKAITDIAGSSGCFAYGIVSYSNEAKEALLDVDPATLQEHGAVSEATVREMAAGVLDLSGADLAVSISGIAGPGGGTAEKPAGTVWFSWASRNSKGGVSVDAVLHRLKGDREAVRRQSVVLALDGVRERIGRNG